MNSNSVRDQGFEEVLKDYPTDQVEKLMEYHQRNGGLSRYVKFRYFFEEIRQESISIEEINDWAQKFSLIMKKMLVNEKLLIEETLNFIKRNHNRLPMIVVSGSDQNELRFLCENLKISQFFRGIYGSPKPKSQWVGELLTQNSFRRDKCMLIGDSINDHHAAEENGIAFMGYNSREIESLSNVRLRLT